MVLSVAALWWGFATQTFAEYGLDNTGLKFNEAVPTLGLEGDKSEKPEEAVELLLLNYVVNPIFYLAGGVAVFMLIFYGARLLLFSGVNEEGLEAAKKNMLWVFVGLLLIVGSYTLVRNVVGRTLQMFMAPPAQVQQSSTSTTATP